MTKEVWEEHPVLYHYTRQAGLLGILETQTLHATNYAFLNDHQEGRLLHSKLETYVKPLLKKATLYLCEKDPPFRAKIDREGGLDFVVQREATVICDGLFEATFAMPNVPNFFEPFVASFCGHRGSYEADHGLLSQWRGYGGDVGYAIAFDTAKLVKFLRLEADRAAYNSAQLSTVVYENDETTFQGEFAALLSSLEEVIPEDFFTGKRSFSALYSSFTENVVRLKHRGFLEEGEVRAVLCPIGHYWYEKLRRDQPEDFEKIKSKEVKTVRFRPTMAPYIVVGEGIETKLPISFIIVGPGFDRDRRQRELKKYLEFKGLDIEVKVSETPLK